MSSSQGHGGMGEIHSNYLKYKTQKLNKIKNRAVIKSRGIGTTCLTAYLILKRNLVPLAFQLGGGDSSVISQSILLESVLTVHQGFEKRAKEYHAMSNLWEGM